MSITNGQPVSAAVTNAAFVSRTTDSTVVSKVTLDKSGSGTTITDTQAVINKALDVIGTTEADSTPNNYSSANFVSNGDNRKVAIGKLDTQLKTTNDNVNAATADIASHETRLDDLETGNMTIAGNKTFSGNTIFNGNITVNGTTTTVNSTTTDVVDPNITVNKGGSNATSEGSGVTVDRVGTKGSFIYKNASASRFAIGDLGSEIDVVSISTTQTLTNKTINGANNTLTVRLANDVTGTLPIANGGTGLTSAGTSGNVLTSNGTEWVSSAPTSFTPLYYSGYINANTAVNNAQLSLANVTTSYTSGVLTISSNNFTSLPVGTYKVTASLSSTSGNGNSFRFRTGTTELYRFGYANTTSLSPAILNFIFQSTSTSDTFNFFTPDNITVVGGNPNATTNVGYFTFIRIA